MSRRFTAVVAAILAPVIAALFVPSAAEAQDATPNPRIALVIGNATYRDAALATPANDAGLVAQTLQAAGFDVVGARDLDGQSLRTAFRDFLEKAAAAGPDMQVFVYLSGRAVQYAGDNYFVPVDAEIHRDADVPIEAIRISDFTHALAAMPGRARIIVLDAARANPYAAQGSALALGLALVDPEPGELIAFNAAPGTLSGDEQGPYGVYGKTLAGAIRQGGVDIAQAFDQTRVLVNSETQGALAPWSASKLDGPYYVFERAADAPPPAGPSPAETDREPISSLSVAEAYAAALERDTIEGYREFLAAFPDSDQANRVRAILAVRREAAYWRRTVAADDSRAYWTYLRAYPRGPHVADARRRLAMLSAAFEPPADFEPEVFADLPPPPPDELAYEERPIYAFDDFGPPPPPPPVQYIYVEDHDWVDLPPPPPPEAIGVLPVLAIVFPVAIGAVAFHDRFRRDGIAPRGEPLWRAPPPAPPPLPANIKPPPPRTPVAPPAAVVAKAPIVKPLPPIGRPRPPGAIPAKPGQGNRPAAAPMNPAATVAPGPATKPLPVPPAAPAAGSPPAATRPAAGRKPQGAPPPAGVAKPIAPSVPGGRPLPVPSPNAGNRGAPLTPVGKPPAGAPPPAATVAPAAPGGKPLPVPAAPASVKPGGATAPSPAAAAPAAPAAPGGKPLPSPAPPAAHTPPNIPTPKPNVVEKPPVAAPHSPAAPPVVRVPAPQPPPVVRAQPAPMVATPPAPHPPPVVRAPAPQLPPVVRIQPAPMTAAPPRPAQPPPMVRAPAPQPQPVVRVQPATMMAAPPRPAQPPPMVRVPAARPPPVVRAQPAQMRACGAPGLPPCPK